MWWVPCTIVRLAPEERMASQTGSLAMEPEIRLKVAEVNRGSREPGLEQGGREGALIKDALFGW